MKYIIVLLLLTSCGNSEKEMEKIVYDSCISGVLIYGTTYDNGLHPLVKNKRIKEMDRECKKLSKLKGE